VSTVTKKNIDEAVLTEIWRRHLKLDAIGPDDDFFAIGGTSLQAAQIFLEIEQVTGLELPITVLLEAPTIRELAAHIQGKQGSDDGSLVLLKPGEGDPLFLIHPVGGTVLVYREIAEAMTFPGPVYGIQAIGLTDGRQPHTSVEEMAEHYCEQVSAVQPDGPLLIAGYSAGGIIAFAMAQRLVKMGREVRYLGLINTHFLFRRRGKQTGIFRRFQGYVRYIRNRKPVNAIRDFLKYVRYRRQLKNAEAILDAKGSTFEERRRKLAAQIMEEYDKSPGNRYSMIQQVQQTAIIFYQPSLYPGTINLYKTADYHDNRPGEIGWERLAGGGIRITRIPGSHLSLVQGENAIAVASILCRDLAPERRSQETC